MKNLKLWQKAGLSLLVALPLALGLGFTTKQNSNLESRILPSITMNTAQAKEVYEVPDLTGYTKVKEGWLDKDKIKDGIKETFVEIFKGPNDYIMKYTANGRTWAYGKIANPRDKINDYIIRDSDCDGIFDEKYNAHTEPFGIPDCLR